MKITRQHLARGIAGSITSAAIITLSACQPGTPPKLKSYQELGELLVATRMDALTYQPSNSGDVDGFEHDLLVELGKHLKIPVKFVVLSDSAHIQDALKRGNVHLAAGSLLRTEDSNEQWSQPIKSLGYQIVQHEGGRRIRRLADLTGSTVGVRPQSLPAAELAKISMGVSNLKVSYPTNGGELELLQQVATNKLDFALVDNLAFAVANNLYPELKSAISLKLRSDIAWRFPPNSPPEFIQSVNDFISLARKTELIDRLSDRYFGHIRRLNHTDIEAFLERTKTRLPLYRDEFKRAQTKTGVDWRLLAAIAYQESQWDPLATSMTNVRGMMMLTEDTAAHLGVKDRLDPQQSIDGGSRYFQYLHSSLQGKGVPLPDATWMAVAAYNLGLGHMNGARAIAKSYRADNNSWLNMRAILPKLSQPEVYARLKSGPARGGEAVIMTENVRSYYDILSRLQQPLMLSDNNARVSGKKQLELLSAAQP